MGLTRNDFEENAIATLLDNCRIIGNFTDVTLATAYDNQFKAHKVIFWLQAHPFK